jgi:hypothetical protein
MRDDTRRVELRIASLTQYVTDIKAGVDRDAAWRGHRDRMAEVYRATQAADSPAHPDRVRNVRDYHQRLLAGYRVGHNVTLTPEMIAAIGAAFDMAHSDQEHYLQVGSAEKDYGAEWPEVAAAKAATFRQLALVADRIGLTGDSDRWNRLANTVEGKD